MEPETATAVPRSPVSCTVRMRGHEIVQDKPEAYGGTDQGPMASEILMASLLACQLSSFVKIRDKRGVQARVEELRAECHFDEKGDISRIELHWVFDAHEGGLDTLVRLTDRVCTISRALKVPVTSTYSR